MPRPARRPSARPPARPPARRLGDRVADALHALTGLNPCAGCRKRRDWLNRLTTNRNG